MKIRADGAQKKQVFYGSTLAVVLVLVKEKSTSAVEPADGSNCHLRAAFSAASAKNWLGARESSSAEETEPSGAI